MENTLEIIRTRRSVRQWLSKSVSESDIHDLLEAAMHAPSAGNEQAWQFIVIKDKKLLDEYALLNKNVAFVKNADVAILVCGDINAQKYAGFYVHDCCAATQNILIAAHVKKLGAVWGNVFPDNVLKIRELLSIPEHIVPFSIVPLGYPAKEPQYENRYDSTKIHTNKW